MGKIAGAAAQPGTAADRYERGLAIGAILLLVAVLVALVRGRAHWAAVPLPVWLHLATVVVALGLTPVMLLRPRGDRIHRLLGWIWALCLFVTAIVSFWIHQIDPDGFSVIHILSGWTVLTAPLIVWFGRRGNVRVHRRIVRGMTTGALLVAGFFTFPFGRMLGDWLFG